jgi:Na+/H+ antiporter NhaA
MPVPVLVSLGLFALVMVAIRLGIRQRSVYALLGVAAWLALSKSGVNPIVIGLGMGLLTFAAPAGRGDLERASALFRRFREQPTPELARSARLGLTSALSPNERLQEFFHPWTSYGIVPLFALANAGVHIDVAFLAQAVSAPIVLGIVIGYLAGKPVGLFLGSWLATKLSRGAVRPPIGWGALAGGGSIAGIGFTVALLIAGVAFRGEQLDEAKLGVLTSALGRSLLTWLVFRGTALLPSPMRARALFGTAKTIVDLAVPVEPERDHLRGPRTAPVTLVE